MKTKSLLLAFAGLGLFACSNEDLNEGGIQGDATVTVRINDAISRAVETPVTGTDDQKFPVTITSATLALEAGAGSNTINLIEQKLISQDGKFNQNAEVVFKNVRNPKKLTLVINNGTDKTVTPLELKNVVGTQLAEPLWQSTTTFNAVSETEYTATLSPEHRLARLQFSGIKHADSKPCIYQTLNIDGIYLDGALKTEGKEDKYSLATDTDPATVWSTISGEGGWDAKIYDAIGGNFLDGAEFPAKVGEGEDAQSQCYAYNILPVSSNLPKLVVCFSNATVKSGVVLPADTKPYRFARVSKYVSGKNEITEFKPGYIYNITGLSISDEDLGFTPEGGKDITLTANVTVTPWTLVNATVEW